MIIENKKALSNVVVAVLLILLAVVAVISVFVVIRKFSNEALLSPTSCLDMQLNSPLIVQKACYNEINKELEIKLARIGEVEINSLDFVLGFGVENEIWCCGEECEDCEIIEKGSKVYYIETNKPEKLNLKINNCVLNPVDVRIC